MQPTDNPQPTNNSTPAAPDLPRSAPVMDVRPPRASEASTPPPAAATPATPNGSHEVAFADVLKEPPIEAGPPSPVIQQALKSHEEQTTAAATATAAAQAKPKAKGNGTGIIITVTVIIMLILAGLAVFAYTQSQ